MKLYHSPGSSSLGIRLQLEMIGADYDCVIIALPQKAQRSPDFLSRNPKGKLPALERADGRVMTEYPVITQWLDETYPQVGLLPGEDDRFEALEIIEYIVASLHMRGATLAMLPQKFSADLAAQADIRATGQAVLREGLEILSKRLGARDWFFDRSGALDATLFYLLHWQPRFDVVLPANLQAHFDRMSASPAVMAALR